MRIQWLVINHSGQINIYLMLSLSFRENVNWFRKTSFFGFLVAILSSSIVCTEILTAEAEQVLLTVMHKTQTQVSSIVYCS